jgi:TIR domain/Caspase domain/SIR2-like domain
MIKRLIEVLNTVGLEISHEQLADALWLALHIPRGQSSAGLVHPPPQTTVLVDAVQENAAPVSHSAAPQERPEQTSTAPKPGELFVPKPGFSRLDQERIPAVTVRVPTVEALPHKNGINRALRPLKRRYPSFRTRVLDVSATVEQNANGGPAIPILRPAQERWMEIALVLDESASMRVWRQTVRELALLLHHHGSFRDVRTWYVNLDGGNVRLYSEAGLPNSPRRLRHPNELIDPLSRRLILVVSDCVAQGWRNHFMFRAIREWGRRGPVALVQVLPERLWTATALTAYPKMLRSYAAGVPNRSLRVQRSCYDEPLGVSDVPLPIINLEAWSVAPWAKLVANVGEATAEGIVLTQDDSEQAVADRENIRTQQAGWRSLSAEEKVRKFRAAASPAAFELAGYLSAAPLFLPVMRLVQKAMMSVVRGADLAEIFLGGLVQQVTLPDQVGHVDQVSYEFYDGVRELLRASVKKTDQFEVLREISRLIERQTGSTIDFQALRADPSGKNQHIVDPVGQKFAEIAADLLNRFEWHGPAKSMPAPQDSAAVARWVLVAGGRRYDVAPAVQSVCELLGRELARHDTGLIGRGWPGVDHLVARSYAADIRNRGIDPYGRILHVLEPGHAQPDFSGGEVVSVESSEQEQIVAIQRSSAIIVISGARRTEAIFRAAFTRGIPVFPLRGTGGTAEKAFDELASRGELFLHGDLARPISTPKDAASAVASLMLLLNAPTPSATLAQQILRTREAVRRYLAPTKNHSAIARLTSEDLASYRTQISPLYISISLQTTDVVERTLGYFLFQAQPCSEAIPVLFENFSVEQNEAERHVETRPLWELLMCVEEVFADGELRRTIPLQAEDVVNHTLAFLEREDRIDPGGECKRELQEMITLLKIGRLADEYNHIRATQPSGSDRTTVMTAVVSRIRHVGSQMGEERVRQLLSSSDPGLRLGAYASLYENPSAALFSAVVQAVTRTENQPFCQYWGLQAVRNVAKMFAPDELPIDLRVELEHFMESLKPGTDRYSVLSSILSEWPSGQPHQLVGNLERNGLPSADTTLAMMLGVSKCPKSPHLSDLPGSANAAEAFYSYLTEVFGLPEENIKDLFDSRKSPAEQLREIGEWLLTKKGALKDLIVFYTGHGGFTAGDQKFFLATRSTTELLEGATSIRIVDLSTVLKVNAPWARKYLIFDCCFASALVAEFTASPGLVAVDKTKEAFPSRGTAILCSSSSENFSIGPPGGAYTRFSEVLFRVLREGDKRVPTDLSLHDVGKQVRERILEEDPEERMRPKVHSPDQTEGDVSSVRLFPNSALRSPATSRHGSLTSDRLSEAKSKEKERSEAERHEREESSGERDRRSLDLDEVFWDDFLARVEAGEVIPVVGPGAVTFGLSDDLLYPWLARRLPSELDPQLTFQEPPHDLQEVVDAQRAKNRPIERIYKHLYRMVEDPDLRPGVTLAALAAIEAFQLFISTTFDPLLPRAVESVSPGGRPEERRGATSLRDASPDLPLELSLMQNPDKRFVYQILGQAKPYRDFVLWDEDIQTFLMRLNQQLPVLPKLCEALQSSHFLVLGLGFADWLLRFFVQVIKQRSLSDLAGTELFVAENLETNQRDRMVNYFSRLTLQIRIVPIGPRDFIAQLHQRWRRRHPVPLGDPFLMSKAHREKQRARGCIFVSYASPDLEIARFIVSQLQKAGLPVWFDKEQIQPGMDWRETLREAVEERCGLFLSIISASTTQRLEGFNILERNLAARRRDKFGDNAIFYLPLRIDDGDPLIPVSEPHGIKTIQGVRKPGGYLDEDFIGYMREKQRENCAALGYSSLADSP